MFSGRPSTKRSVCAAAGITSTLPSETMCGGWHYFYTAIGDALAVLKSSVNFGVYVLTSRRFRRGVLNALRCVSVVGFGRTQTETELPSDTRVSTCRRRPGVMAETLCVVETVLVAASVSSTQSEDGQACRRADLRLNRWKVLPPPVCELTTVRSSPLAIRTPALSVESFDDEIDELAVPHNGSIQRASLITSPKEEPGSSKESTEALFSNDGETNASTY